MSTSDRFPGSADLDNVVDLTGATAAAAAGMPDPALLARLAGELFGALSRESGAGATHAVTAAIPTATVPTSTAQLSGVSTAAPGIPPAAAAPSALASAVGLPDVALAPGFSFLSDVRSIESLARGVAGAATSVATSGSASETHIRSLASAAPAMPGVQAIPAASVPPGTSGLPELAGVPGASELADSMAIPGTMAAGAPASDAAWGNFAAPQIAGVATPLSGWVPDAASFGFIDVLRPLDAIGVAPNPSSITSGLGGLRASDLSTIPFDVQAIRRDFPILDERVNGRPLVWLDNAATTQKPQSVIDRLSHFYAHENSNVHRAAHTLAARATDAYEAARETVRRFLNASSTREIIFVRGTTEGINLIAQSWGRRNVQKDDEIVITWLEHHANIVPWQMLCAEKGAKLRVAPVDDHGQILLDEYERLLGPRTRLVSFSHVSNALGTVTPVEEMVAMAHRHGAKVLVDAAQSVAHTRVDVQQFDCDFLVFSGHKIFAPTGIGAVYGKADILEHTPPWQGGGNMISDVTFEKTTYNQLPVRFEAGTGSIGDAVGLGAAIDYVERVGMVNIGRYEHELLAYGTEVLRRIPGLRFIGTAPEKASILSFVLDGYRTEDVGAALSRQGIAVRAGHHCAQPIVRRFGLESTVRPSLAFYNTCEEIDALAAALWNLKSGLVQGML